MSCRSWLLPRSTHRSCPQKICLGQFSTAVKRLSRLPQPPLRASPLSTCLRLYEKRLTTSAFQDKLQPVSTLPDWDVLSFREQAFDPKVPAVLRPDDSSMQLPAVQSWFKTASDRGSRFQILNYEYLSKHGDTPVSLELTSKDNQTNHTTFNRFTAPLSFFLNWMNTQHHTSSQAETPSSPSQSLYLAQHQLTSLPTTLQSDLPTPPLILQAGKGDIYDSNIWIGTPPTYTPLHRDPNPNLFLQLAGRKVIRLFPPAIGRQMFSRVQAASAGNDSSDTFRGDEMMQGQEREMLERAVWGVAENVAERRGEEPDRSGLAALPWREACYEAVIDQGAALFIPLGWWHSVKSIGTGVSASVNWWFR